MASYSKFPGGFRHGVIIRGVPIVQTHPGRVFWVSNATSLLTNAGSSIGSNQATGSDSNDGTFDRPWATIAYAFTQCVANRGDIIFVKPGHAESVTAAAGMVWGVAGVALIGLGMGSMRPTITHTTANTATITLTANNVTVSNILFVGGFLNVAAAIDVVNAQVANDFVVDNCEFRDGGAALNFVKCVRFGTTTGISDGFVFSNNTVIGLASSPGAGTTAIASSSIGSRWKVTNNWVTHQILLANTSALIAMGSTSLTNSLIQGNVTDRPNTSSTAGDILSTSGTAYLGTLFADNYAGTLSANGLIAPVSTTAQFINNYCMITGAQDKSALINPAAV